MSAKKSITLWALALVLLCVPAFAIAQGVFSPSGAGATRATGADVLLDGWSSFADGWMLLDRCIVLLISLILGTFIAYHPSTRRRVSSIEHFEQPKTFLMYSLVATVVALIVKEEPNMAFVVFGIGGLMRFRTNVGEAKDTGRVILVTVVGLCCGLKLFVVAIPATIIGWLVIYFLEQQIAGVIRVSGVEQDKLRQAVDSYRKLIAESGCSIIGEQSKFQKREFLFMVSALPGFDRDALQAQLETLPEELRGKVDWERL